MLRTALFSTAFGAFLLVFACFEYWMGDLECAASTSVLSGIFVGAGALLFVVRRRQRASLTKLASRDFTRLDRNISHKLRSPKVAPPAQEILVGEAAELGQSGEDGDGFEPATDFRSIGKRPDVKRIIDELRNQSPKRQR